MRITEWKAALVEQNALLLQRYYTQLPAEPTEECITLTRELFTWVQQFTWIPPSSHLSLNESCCVMLCATLARYQQDEQAFRLVLTTLQHHIAPAQWPTKVLYALMTQLLQQAIPLQNPNILIYLLGEYIEQDSALSPHPKNTLNIASPIDAMHLPALRVACKAYHIQLNFLPPPAHPLKMGGYAWVKNCIKRLESEPWSTALYDPQYDELWFIAILLIEKWPKNKCDLPLYHQLCFHVVNNHPHPHPHPDPLRHLLSLADPTLIRLTVARYMHEKFEAYTHFPLTALLTTLDYEQDTTECISYSAKWLTYIIEHLSTQTPLTPQHMWEKLMMIILAMPQCFSSSYLTLLENLREYIHFNTIRPSLLPPSKQLAHLDHESTLLMDLIISCNASLFATPLLFTILPFDIHHHTTHYTLLSLFTTFLLKQTGRCLHAEPTIQYLLALGAHPLQAPPLGDCALICAIRHTKHALVEQLVTALIHTPEFQPTMLSPALQCALQHYHPEIIQCLINHGAIPKTPDDMSSLMLHIRQNAACTVIQPLCETIRAHNDADDVLTEQYQFTVLHAAVLTKNTANIILLLQYFPSLCSLFYRNADCDVTQDIGMPPLLLACETQHIQNVSLLLKATSIYTLKQLITDFSACTELLDALIQMADIPLLIQCHEKIMAANVLEHFLKLARKKGAFTTLFQCMKATPEKRLAFQKSYIHVCYFQTPITRLLPHLSNPLCHIVENQQAILIPFLLGRNPTITLPFPINPVLPGHGHILQQALVSKWSIEDLQTLLTYGTPHGLYWGKREARNDATTFVHLLKKSGTPAMALLFLQYLPELVHHLLMNTTALDLFCFWLLKENKTYVDQLQHVVISLANTPQYSAGLDLISTYCQDEPPPKRARTALQFFDTPEATMPPTTSLTERASPSPR